ncbi:MAG: disulfide bond formation protein B, partial [Pseudomonadota bacterium]
AAYLLWGGPAGRALAGLTALGFAVGAGIAVMHTGVEFGWWEGVTSCSGGLDLGGSTEDVLARIREAPVVRCDARESFLLGLSMTNWNLLASAGLAAAFGRAAQVGGRAGARSPA